jgi:ABC-type Mn2+/Zn2+ transport system ATPase subunit
MRRSKKARFQISNRKSAKEFRNTSSARNKMDVQNEATIVYVPQSIAFNGGIPSTHWQTIGQLHGRWRTFLSGLVVSR